ncbi:MAG: dynamin family protein [Propionivibrio sp.]
MNLADYERAKFELAGILRTVSLEVKKDSGENDPEWLRELFVQLAEDRFNLVVVGRFSRGKTTLMNAILGMDRLPVGIVPLTSVITSVAFGSKEEVRIRYQDRLRLVESVPLERLRNYVTQEFNPGNARRVAVAEVRLPAEILRRGFHFVDTPGLGSAIVENTLTTASFLPEADAFVLVTSFESPPSGEELDILRIASASARRIFVVVNKQDLATPAERETALAYIREQAAGVLGGHLPALFPLAAREGLEARLAGDAAALAASGLPAFESALTHFLLDGKRGALLLAIAERIAARLRVLPPSETQTRLTAAVEALSQRLAAEETLPAAEAASPGALSPLRACPVCAQIAGATFEFLRHFQYELSISAGLQRAHAERGGLCPQHTWDYGTLTSPHGFCLGNPPLLERLAERFAALAEETPTAGSLADAIASLTPTSGACVVCAEQRRAESKAVAALARRLRGAGDAEFDVLPVICLPHLRRLAAALDDAASLRRLMAREAAVLQRVAEDMRRYATQHDAVRRELSSDDELHADRNAMNALAGQRHINPRTAF